MQPNYLRQMTKPHFIVPLALLSVSGWQMRALAHGVAIDYQTTQAIEITALYDTGEPMANAQVIVYAPEDPSTPWMTATTSESGKFTFTPDRSQPGNWEIAVRQAGHGEILNIPVESETLAAPELQEDAVQSEAGGPANSPSPTIEATRLEETARSNGTGSLSPMQRVLMAGSALWGFVGTALFFVRGKK